MLRLTGWGWQVVRKIEGNTGHIPSSMAKQPPPPYPVAEPEKTPLAGGSPSVPPPDAQDAATATYPPQYSASWSAYPPPPGAQGQPPYPSQSPQSAPYPTQPYPPAAQAPPVGATGYPASAPPPSVSYSIPICLTWHSWHWACLYNHV